MRWLGDSADGSVYPRRAWPADRSTGPRLDVAAGPGAPGRLCRRRGPGRAGLSHDGFSRLAIGLRQRQGLGARPGSNRRRFGNCKRCPGGGRRQRTGSRLVYRAGSAPPAARGADVHKQDRRDRTIPVAVIVAVLFVAIAVAVLIWLAAS
jgi:hypothetical protein